MNRQYRLYYIGGPEDGTIRIMDKIDEIHHIPYSSSDYTIEGESSWIAEYRCMQLPRSAELTMNIAVAIFQGWNK